MTTAVVVVIVVLVLAVAVGARVWSAGSSRRSVKSYERALQVLGDVSRRSDAAAPIHPVRPDEVARTHLRTEVETGSEAGAVSRGSPGWTAGPRPLGPPAPSAPFASQASPAAPVQPPSKPALVDVPAVFEDDSAFDVGLAAGADAGAGDSGAGADALAPETTSVASERPSKRTRPESASVYRASSPPPWRLAVLSTAAVVVLVAFAVLGIHLSGGSTPSRGASPPSPHHSTGGQTHRSHGHKHHKTGSKSKGASHSHTVAPLSSSPSLVAFAEPKGKYTVTFSVTGAPCWLGIQLSTGGPYVWDGTLQPGQQKTWTATQSISVDVGAPQYLSLRVDGKPATLPHYTNAYELTFGAVSSSASN